MKTVRNLLALLGLLYVGRMAAQAIGTAIYNKISYTFGSPNFNTNFILSSNPFLRVTLPVTIDNKNSIGLDVQGFSGQVYYGNVYLSNVNIPVPVQIPANGQATLVLEFDVYATQLITDLIQSITTQGALSTILGNLKLVGTFNAMLGNKVIPVPVEQNLL